jgi:hypothetical protein
MHGSGPSRLLKNSVSLTIHVAGASRSPAPTTEGSSSALPRDDPTQSQDVRLLSGFRRCVGGVLSLGQFSTSEFWWIVGYCIGWTLVFEAIALAGAVTGDPPLVQNPTQGLFGFVVPFTVALDSFFVWGAFKYKARKAIESYLARHPRPPEVDPKGFGCNS